VRPLHAVRYPVRYPLRPGGPGRSDGGGFMPWLLVVVAGLFEMGFAVLLKQSAGFSRLWPTVGFAACALISFGLLTLALRQLEVGPAYAVWTGIGAAGTAIVGMAALGESVSAIKIISIALILGGVIGLNLSGVTP
jgi:quaternary ammonium compound-resistance protein SugE